MPITTDLRAGEIAAALPPASDAQLVFIGRIRTPWTDRQDCPRQGSHDGPDCTIEVFPAFADALDGIGENEQLEVLYWLHEARRDLVRQNPGHGLIKGTFALRSPMRPNPIGTSLVKLVAVRPAALVVRGLDCIDGTPLVDLKPERSTFSARHKGS